MRTATTRGVICVTDAETLLTYHLARIEYTEREDGSFRYVISPNYSVLELVGPPLFQGIPGINLETRRREFIRENRTPVFVSERTPAENREDVRELLDEEGLEYLNRLEWLIRTKTRYSGDNLHVERLDDREDAPFEAGDLSDAGARSAQAMKTLLEAIGQGRVVEGDGFRIDDSNRKEMHELLRALYVKEKSFLDERRREGAAKAAERGRYRGRQPLRLDDVMLADLKGRYESGLLDAEQAAAELGVSRATFFRRIKALRESSR